MFNILAAFAEMLGAAIVSNTPELQAQKSDVESVIPVHAQADGSGRRGAYEILGQGPRIPSGRKTGCSDK